MSTPGSRTPGSRTTSAKWTLAVLLLAAPLVVWGALLALRSTSNDPRQWLPRDFAETDRYDWFLEQFGSDEIAVVSWPGCTLEDPRLEAMASGLRASPWFERVRSGPAVIERLMQPPLELSERAAARRLRGVLVGPDAQTTCLVLSTSEAGKSDRVQTVDAIFEQAQQVPGLDAESLRLGGPTVDAAAIDRESRRLLFQLAGVSGLLSFIIATIRLRSVAMAVIVLAVAGYSTLLSLAILAFTGGTMNLLMTMLPPLVYVLSISSAVHLANYYRDALEHASPAAALGQALRHGWLPCALAALTTGIGLASLVLSKIDPIRTFGIYSASGIVAGVAVLFVLMPAALTVFRVRPAGKRSATGETPAGKTAAGENATDKTQADQDAAELAWAHGGATAVTTRDFGERVIDFIIRRHGWVLVVCLTIMALGAVGLPRVKSTVRLQDRFLPGSPAIQDYRWLEENIGPMVPLEVVVHIDRDSDQSLVEQLRTVARVQGRIQAMDDSVATMSAINFSPSLPRRGGVADVARRQMINRPETLERLRETGYVTDTDEQRLWRITVRAPAIGELDYGLFAERLRGEIDPILAAAEASGTYTGVIPLIYKAQRQLLQDLFRSFLAAFGVIAVVLVVVLRSVWAAALAMIPNLFPAVVVFGGLEWVDIPIQIGSVMTASAALGIAVDDTVHFLTWFRRGIGEGRSRLASLRLAFHRCAGAMLHTTLICCGGLLVFAASSFVPILHFAWLMVALLLAAIIGDLALLPAILAGPLGRRFERRRRQDKSPTP